MLKDTWALDLDKLEWSELKDAGFPGSSVSNHLAYDPANGVLLLLGHRGGLSYGYSCGIYAMRYDGGQRSEVGGQRVQGSGASVSERPGGTPAPSGDEGAAKPETRNPKPETRTAIGYDLAALPKASGTWTALETGALAGIQGWCQRP